MFELSWVLRMGKFVEMAIWRFPTVNLEALETQLEIHTLSRKRIAIIGKTLYYICIGF